ncbi:2-dehydropantoate 2-reductase [Umezawaea sp. Da 62-37]|uniref:2-dehydropantoate 2-reductase n=1 Tax=Umezawaea sp. Da 62-37 TaxID=3075927 RepID=UPI0028F72B9E|nr:2-dehydropantoate 2-reductase [Umezawaea sp. Da 62-37]WNV87742.1 2-dehydropantoate 2-reductase [Umezawaea sp. Da 62-37]
MSGNSGDLRIAVVGTGGIGGYFGGCLAAAGHDVRFLARGEDLAALRSEGLSITGDSTSWAVPEVLVSDSPQAIGEVDFVLLCVKTMQLSAAAAALGPLIGEDTAVVTVQNGVEAPGRVAAVIGRGRVLPGVVRVVATKAGPGRIRHVGGPGAVAFTEWDSSASKRVLRLREALTNARLATPEPKDIWTALWSKFLLMAPVGSIGAATGGATIGELRSREGTRRMLIAGMREVQETGIALGIGLPADAVDTAIRLADQQHPEARTSLQQDILAGRPSELDAWTGAVVRLAHRAGREAPVHEMLYELLVVRSNNVRPQ